MRSTLRVSRQREHGAPEEPEVREEEPAVVSSSPPTPVRAFLARLEAAATVAAVVACCWSDDEVPLVDLDVMAGLEPAGVVAVVVVVDNDKPGDALGVVGLEPGVGGTRRNPGDGTDRGGGYSSIGLGRGDTPAGDFPAFATALAIARSRFSRCSFSRFFLEVPFFNLCFLPPPLLLPRIAAAAAEVVVLEVKAAAASSGVGKSGSSRSMTPHPPPAS